LLKTLMIKRALSLRKLMMGDASIMAWMGTASPHSLIETINLASKND